MSDDDVVLCTINVIDDCDDGRVMVRGDGRDDGRVMVRLHVIPWSLRGRVHEAQSALRGPLVGSQWVTAVLDHVILKRVRQLLGTLDLLRLDIQGPYDAMRRIQARDQGQGRPTSLASIPHPLLAHDACTLFSTLALEQFTVPSERLRALAGLAGRDSLPATCEACCLEHPWTVSCFRPGATVRGGMRLTAYELPVAWCWQCRSLA